MDTTYDSINVYRKLNLTAQEVLLLNSLEEFYQNKYYFDLLSLIVDDNEDMNNEDMKTISRRTFEYFVTNYSAKHNISYEIEEKGIKQIFIVHSSYKDQLKAHKKKYFDPFARGDRIPFFAHNECIITTIGQLNFYKWFFTKKIYDYCVKNYNVIQNELLSNKNVKKRITHNHTKKRPLLDKRPINYIKLEYTTMDNAEIIVSFDC